MAILTLSFTRILVILQHKLQMWNNTIMKVGGDIQYEPKASYYNI